PDEEKKQQNRQDSTTAAEEGQEAESGEEAAKAASTAAERAATTATATEATAAANAAALSEGWGDEQDDQGECQDRRDRPPLLEIREHRLTSLLSAPFRSAPLRHYVRRDRLDKCFSPVSIAAAV